MSCKRRSARRLGCGFAMSGPLLGDFCQWSLFRQQPGDVNFRALSISTVSLAAVSFRTTSPGAMSVGPVSVSRARNLRAFCGPHIACGASRSRCVEASQSIAGDLRKQFGIELNIELHAGPLIVLRRSALSRGTRGFFRFMSQCAKGPRRCPEFRSGRLLDEHLADISRFGIELEGIIGNEVFI